MKILIVVDMQNDFIDGSLGTPEAQAIVPKVKEKIEEYRKNGYPIFFTRNTHYKNYLETQEGRNLSIKHCIFNTKGWQIKEDLDYPSYNNSYYINKGSFGYPNWYNSALFCYFIESSDEIELVGVCTDICVVSNALILKSQFPETKITVDASCCAGTTVENHKAALKVMESCQINIINKKEVFDWEEFISNSNLAVHCKTEKEANDFCKKMHEHDLSWITGQSYLEDTLWDDHQEDTVYYSDGEYGNIKFARKEDHIILNWSDYME